MKWIRIVDGRLFAFALLASLLGVFFVFDAGYARSIRDGYGPVPREAVQQLVYLGVAVFVSLVIAAPSSEKWRKWAVPLFILSFITVILPLVPGIGIDHNGAHRWIKVGVEVQPAEFAKVAAVLFLAAVFANRPAWPQQKRKLRNWGEWADRVLVPKLKRCMPAFFVLAMVILIEMGPDLGTAAVVAATAFAMFVMGGARKTTLVVGGVVAVLGIIGLVAKEPYRLERFDKHAHRWSGSNMDDIGYQTVQSELAMASGGVIGVGIGAGRAKHLLPAATTDFIPATIGEEFGMLGILLVLGSVAAVALRLMVLAKKCQSTFGSLVLGGVGAWIGIQGIVNVTMANGTLPAIGIPLPFISYGGSSLLALWIALGLCQAAVAPVPVAKAVVSMEEKVENRGNRRRNRRTRLSRA